LANDCIRARIISDSNAAKLRKSSSKLFNREKNGGQRNWFRKKSRIGPAASTNQSLPFSYWLCVLALIFSYWPCFQELLFSNS